jgi:hypothetical protein
MENPLELLQYPTGRFTLPPSVDEHEIKSAIEKIALFPKQMRETVTGLDQTILETPYRPGGWTIRQVVHHCADSHMNAFIRFKLALTEEDPVIKPYDQARWAMQTDYHADPMISIILLESLHNRWVQLMNAMDKSDWDKSFIHPEYNRVQKLRQTVMLYAWHGNHHLGHIRNALRSISVG